MDKIKTIFFLLLLFYIIATIVLLVVSFTTTDIGATCLASFIINITFSFGLSIFLLLSQRSSYFVTLVICLVLALVTGSISALVHNKKQAMLSFSIINVLISVLSGALLLSNQLFPNVTIIISICMMICMFIPTCVLCIKYYME